MESDLLVCYHDDIGWSPLHRLCTKACEQEVFHYLVDLYKAKTISFNNQATSFVVSWSKDGGGNINPRSINDFDHIFGRNSRDFCCCKNI